MPSLLSVATEVATTHNAKAKALANAVNNGNVSKPKASVAMAYVVRDFFLHLEGETGYVCSQSDFDYFRTPLEEFKDEVTGDFDFDDVVVKAWELLCTAP